MSGPLGAMYFIEFKVQAPSLHSCWFFQTDLDPACQAGLLCDGDRVSFNPLDLIIWLPSQFFWAGYALTGA